MIILLVLLRTLVFSQTDKEYLTAAKKSANWITSLEISHPVSDGIYWQYREGSRSGGGTSYASGAAGIGTFFLKLYQITGESQYLIKARKAGNYISNSMIADNIWSTEWFYGAAGAGMYFLDLYQETLDPDLLENVIYYGDYLINNKHNYKDGCYWNFFSSSNSKYTGIAHGNAGIGLFLLELFEFTGDSTYLSTAEKAFIWMSYHTVSFGENALGWKRLTTDEDVYHLWCGGSTGILFFLIKLYKVTEKSIYKEYIKKTANGLCDYAVKMDNGHAWHYSSSIPTNNIHNLPIIYCHGASSVVHALYAANSVIQNNQYLNVAISGAEWVMNNKIQLTEDAYYWRHFYDYDRVDTGLLTGIASVGHGFIAYYEFDQNQEYIEHAKYAANCLIEIADHPTENMLRWQSLYRGHQDPEDRYYEPGWYSGVAGIGIFFLELYEFLNSYETMVLIEKKIYEYGINISSYPNPFNSSCKISFRLPETERITLKIFNSTGKEIITLADNKKFLVGWNHLTWNSQNNIGFSSASGVYIISILSDKYHKTEKIVLLK